MTKNTRGWDFPGGQWLCKTLHFQCRGPGSIPWSGNYIPHATTKDPCATTKDLTHHNEDRRSHIPELRPSTANKSFFLITHILSAGFDCHEFGMGLMGLKLKSIFLLEAPGKNRFLAVPASRSCSHSLAPWPPPVFKASTAITPTSVSAITSLILTLQLPSYSDPCGYIRPTGIIPDDLSISKSLT